jgi:hypothetical protein
LKTELKLFRLKGFPRLESEIRKSALSKLNALKKRDPKFEARLHEYRVKRPDGMPPHEYLKLRVLSRQFDGNRTPGLSTLVRAARFVVKRLRRWVPKRGMS